MVAETESGAGTDERAKQEAWRLEVLLGAGYSRHRAELLAVRADVDLHLAVRLLEQGCAQKLVLRILL